ncbi:hypothetical protein V5O48_016895 [Marasmius crinis-equi]|uniref:F-box domain-containing protein n=1 Tax=Marasmius crinis-equi TaxID=585013 RepID=A0ABR3EQQ6_9AGAR
MPTATELPAEIIAEIFLRCPYDRSTFEVEKTPWILGRVCRRWREVALGMPELWKRIWITRDVMKPNRKRFATDVLRAVLDRASGGNLRVYINLWKIFPSDPDLREMFRLLRSTSNRWEVFELRSRTDPPGIFDIPLYPCFDASEETPFASLKELYIITRLKHFDFDGKLVRALVRAPSLNVLAIRSKPEFKVEEAEAVPVPSFAWEGITHLETGGFYGRQYSEILYQCTKLHTLVIDDLNSTGREGTEIPTIRLETIRRLRLSLYNRWTGRKKESKAFCEALVLPGLKELEVVRGVNTAIDFDSLGGLVRRSGCELSSVSIQDISIMDVAVGEFLRTTPEVASLTVKGRLFGHLFEAMASDPDFLPRMKRLTVLVADDQPLSPPLAAILKVARARARQRISLIVEAFENAPNAYLLEETRSVASVRYLEPFYDTPEAYVVEGIRNTVNSVVLFRGMDDDSRADLVRRQLKQNTPVLEEIFSLVEEYHQERKLRFLIESMTNRGFMELSGHIKNRMERLLGMFREDSM